MFEFLKAEEEFIKATLKPVKPMNLTNEEKQKQASATHCYGCLKSFAELKALKLKKTADHDRVTGLYKGAACSRCNLAFQPRKFKSKFTREKGFYVPIFLHNGSGYDTKLILKDFVKVIHRNADWLLAVSELV
jgi:hypothetical protein